MATNLFEQLAGARDVLVPVVLQPGQFIRDAVTGRDIPIAVKGSSPIRFDIRTISGDEVSAADAILDKVKPPVIEREEPNPKGVGTIRVHAGYDHDSPDYVAQRNQLLPLRHAMVCLAGCPALLDSTPGDSPEAKAKLICTRLGAALVEWMAQQIENLAVLNAVGQEDVERFFPEGSGPSQKRPASGKASPRTSKRKSSAGSTEPTSPTGSGKPLADG
jgi:hypothetical protein